MGYKGTFQIETNATVEPKTLEGADVKITLSPKVTCNYYVASPNFIKRVLARYGELVLELKLVVGKDDLKCAKRFLSELGEVKVPIILQPLHQGNYSEEAKEVVKVVLEDKELRNKVRIIPQVHKFLKID